MDQIGQDIRFAVRQLMRKPGFALVAVITLGLGIGSSSGIFTVVNGVLLTPLPYDEPDRLVAVWHAAPGVGFDRVLQSPALHFTYEDEGSSFVEMGMWDNGSVTVTGSAVPEQVAVMNVTEGTLKALRAQPHIGRRFTAEDDSPETPETVILSHGYWQSHYAGNPDVIGETMRIDGRLVEIIGVMPQAFRFPRYDPSLILPFRFDRGQLSVGNFSYRALARLAPGISIEQANAEIDRLVPAAVERFPGGMTMETKEQAQFAAALLPLMDEVVGDIGDVLWILLGTVGIVLLIACANVANLLLVQADGRLREVSVRAAIGAGRARVARQLFTESVTLGVLGGVLGVGLAAGGLDILRATQTGSLPRLNEITMDPKVLLFALGISILAGLIIGVFPVLMFWRSSLAKALKEGGRGSSHGRERQRARNTLVVAQMALALVLLIGSGLMIRSFQALKNVDPGFRDPGEILTLRLSIPEPEIEDAVAAARAHELIAHRIAEIPAVASVGLSTSITMDLRGSNESVFVEDFPTTEGQMPPIRRVKWVGQGYFATMQIPILAGRDISWADIHDLNPVVVVTESFAREYWDRPSDALGKRVGAGRDPEAGGWREIVGVVGDVRDDGMSQDPTNVVFWPMITPNPWRRGVDDEPIAARRHMAYAIRSPQAATTELIQEVREAIWAVNPNLPLLSVGTVEEILERSISLTSFTLMMLAIAGGVALILSTIGVYGVISYVVTRRRREIGVRIALGAEPGKVADLFLRQGLTLAGAGVVVGLVSAFGATRLMSALLFGVRPVDPVTFVAVPIGLTGVALLASYLPARRAAGTDPVEALRAE